MSRNGSTWPGPLPTSPLATPEGDHNLSRRRPSVFSRREVTDYGGPSTDTNDLGLGRLYDVNESLEVATANVDMAVSVDEYNAYQNCASTNSAPLPPLLSALSSPDLKGLPSPTSVGSSEMDVALQYSLLGAPRMNCLPFPPLSPSPQRHGPSTPSTYNDVSTNEHQQDTRQRERQPEMVPLMLPIAQRIISGYFKPTKLVIDQQISLIDMRSVLSALQHCLRDLTIRQIGVGQPTSPSTTAKINLSHLTFLKVDQVGFAFLKELLAGLSIDSLTALDLFVGSLEGMPDELNLGWEQLTDVVLHDDFYPETLYNLMGSLRDVTQLKWLGDLKQAKANCNQDTHKLEFLKDVSVCSNKDGCSFFIRILESDCVEKLHLSHFPLGCEGHSFSAVKNISIEHEISADQFLATLRQFPTLVNADFKIDGSTVTEQSEWSTMEPKIASLASLTLRGVSAPIGQLLMPVPLSKSNYPAIVFDSKEAIGAFGLSSERESSIVEPLSR